MNELEFQAVEFLQQVDILKKIVYIYEKDIYNSLSKDIVLNKIDTVRNELNKLECMLNN